MSHRYTQEIDGKLGSLVSSERGVQVTRRIYPHSINGSDRVIIVLILKTFLSHCQFSIQ